MTLEAQLAELKSDKTSGSSQLYSKLKNLLIKYPDQITSETTIQKIKELRKRWIIFPVATHFISYVLKEIKKNNDHIHSIEKYDNSWSGVEKEIAQKLAANEDLNDKKILLHSQSGTVQQVLIQLKKQHQHNFDIFQTESRPNFEGRYQAEVLNKYFPVTLFPDADMARMVDKCDYIILGADVLTNNFFINKTGSYLLWLCAQHFKKKLLIITDSRKVVKENEEIFKEKVKQEYPQDEIWNKKSENIKILNRYFEMIPIKDCIIYSNDLSIL